MEKPNRVAHITKPNQTNNTCIVDTIWIFWAPLGHRDLVPTSSMLTVTSNAPTPKATEDPGLALEHLGEPRGVGDTSLESDTQHCCSASQRNISWPPPTPSFSVLFPFVSCHKASQTPSVFGSVGSSSAPEQPGPRPPLPHLLQQHLVTVFSPPPAPIPAPLEIQSKKAKSSSQSLFNTHTSIW